MSNIFGSALGNSDLPLTRWKLLLNILLLILPMDMELAIWQGLISIIPLVVKQIPFFR